MRCDHIIIHTHHRLIQDIGYWKTENYNYSTEFQDRIYVTSRVGPLEKQPHEDDVDFYNRIFQRKPNESDEDFDNRITIIKRQLPHLPLWKNDLYKNYITTVDTGPESEVTVTTTTTKNKKSSPSNTPTDETEVSLNGRW